MRIRTINGHFCLVTISTGLLLSTALACSQDGTNSTGASSGTSQTGATASTSSGSQGAGGNTGGTSSTKAADGSTSIGSGGKTETAPGSGGTVGGNNGVGGTGGSTAASGGGSSGSAAGGERTSVGGGASVGGAITTGGRSGGGTGDTGGATARGGANDGGTVSGGSTAKGGTASGGSIASGGSTATAGKGGAAGSSASWCLPVSAHPQGQDWAKALIDGRKNANFTWFYPDGLFQHGVYLAYKRINDASYLSMVKKYADANLGGVSTYGTLDAMQPAWVLMDMYRETKDTKYTTTPQKIATRLETTYPKTSDGGFWHTDTGSFGANQLWGDGVFMVLPQYVEYGVQLNHAQAIDSATEQLIIYDKHVAAPNNLHVHQWNAATNKQSCCQWCRAEGWYEMALLIVMDSVPTTHRNYPQLIEIVQRLAKGVAATQDPATGRWWQVMDKAGAAGNWLETSCTAMHAYFLSKASQKGYIDAATYAPLAIKGFNGEMQMVSKNASGSVDIKNICPGTGVLASAAEYYARPPATNDNHGLGAFLLMYDQLTCH